MNSHRLADLTWPEIAALQENAPVAIVPLGACEQHGPGLAQRTDTTRAEFHGTADTVISYDGSASHLGATLPAIMDWVQGWAVLDRCASASSNPIGTDVLRFTYRHCAADAEIRHYRIEGGGHTWPGATIHNGPGVTTQTISATEVMWRFFRMHPLREPQ